MINVCRRCVKPLVLRRRRSTNKQFWGCSDYPECKYTEPFVAAVNEAMDVELFKESTLAFRLCCDRVSSAIRSGIDIPISDALVCADVLRELLRYVEFWKCANDPQIWDALYCCDKVLKAAVAESLEIKTTK